MSLVQAHRSFGGAGQWNALWWGEALDTLLGPEGSDDTCRLELAWPLRGLVGSGGVCGLVFLVVGPAEVAAHAAVGVGCRLYFENFTVDASIFVVSSF